MKQSHQKGFTLIELLVVVLILGVLAAVAIPAYLSSVGDAKVKTTNSNAATIATAVQTAYIKAGGAAYNVAPMTNLSGTILTDLGNSLPINACTGGKVVGTDWVITNPTANSWKMVPATGTCTTAPATVTLG